MFDLDLYFQGQIVFWKIKFSIFFSNNAFKPCYVDAANLMEISNWGKVNMVEEKMLVLLQGSTLGRKLAEWSGARPIRFFSDLAIIISKRSHCTVFKTNPLKTKSGYFEKWGSRMGSKTPNYWNFLFLINFLFLYWTFVRAIFLIK